MDSSSPARNLGFIMQVLPREFGGRAAMVPIQLAVAARQAAAAEDDSSEDPSSEPSTNDSSELTSSRIASARRIAGCESPHGVQM